MAISVEELQEKFGDVPRHADTDTPGSAWIGIRFNGQEINNYVAFNVDEGWVRRYVKDSRGQIKMERGEYVAVKFEGKVEPYWRGHIIRD